jgi:hypothetical protein
MDPDVIHNERIKLLAGALNNLGVGTMIAGLVAPLVNGVIGNFVQTIEWFMFGANLIAGAQGLPGRLRT